MVKTNEAMSGVSPFIRIKYLKQQSSILWCFYRLKFENGLFSNKFFSCTILHSKGIIYLAGKVQVKYFVKN